MEWKLNSPHKHDFHAEKYGDDDLRKNFCRNPGKSQNTVWCFTTDPKKKWDYCAEVEPKAPEGLWGVKGKNYRGKQTQTRSGKTCQAWLAQSPRSHKVTPQKHPHAGLVDNQCRNPNGKDSIWCFTTEGEEEWELCDPLIEEVKADTDEPLSQEDLDGKDKDSNYRGS